ncbi:MAG: hypothetical protein ABJF10_28965 [Chthoniobacter sp.]|uniref:hypothetical protein n=1 Tax=Chthoniobacter sp. TaxID=2510640 RepID=UPI0032A3F990
MKSVVLTVSIPATILNCQVNAGEDIAEGPSTDVPELKELHHYAGQWEDEIAGRPDARRTELGEWILNGRFLRQSWSTESNDGAPPAHGLTIMTFDTERKVYRSWAFLATGSVIENEGVWDAITKTFTWGHRVPESAGTVITKTSFAADATQSWSIVKTDEHDKVIREVAGRSIRQSLPALHAA